MGLRAGALAAGTLQLASVNLDILTTSPTAIAKPTSIWGNHSCSYIVYSPLSRGGRFQSLRRYRSFQDEFVTQNLHSAAHYGSHFEGICGYVGGHFKGCILYINLTNDRLLSWGGGIKGFR